jgi:hypothetical protein
MYNKYSRLTEIHRQHSMLDYLLVSVAHTPYCLAGQPAVQHSCAGCLAIDEVTMHISTFRNCVSFLHPFWVLFALGEKEYMDSLLNHMFILLFHFYHILD